MDKEPMTVDGYRQMQEEVKKLRSIERPAVVRAISEAREHGDISENAEYHAAKERQGFIEARVADLEDKISRAEVIDVSKLTGSTVTFGATVKLVDEENGGKSTYQIVGTSEGDIKAGKLAVSAPLARALIGKSKGDSVEVATPSGDKYYEILAVTFK